MNIFECAEQHLGNNKALITRLINDEVEGNIAPTTISRIYEGNAKESITALVKYALLNILTLEAMNHDSSECASQERHIYVECPKEPALEKKLNNYFQELSDDQVSDYVSRYLASLLLDDYSGLERVIGVMIRDYCHDHNYPQGYEPSYQVYVDARVAKFELVRKHLKEWLI